MNTRRKFIMAASCAAVAYPAGLWAQTPYRPEYKVSVVSPPGTAWYAGAEQFVNLARERTSGRVNMKLFPGASLVQGQQQRELTAMRQGLIDVIVGVPVNWSGTIKDFAMFYLPFLVPDSKAFDAVMQSEAMTKDFFSIVRKAGMEPLAVAEFGYQQLVNSKRPIITPNDLKGLKIRTGGTPMIAEQMSALGANPTSMSWAEAQAALSSGALDGLTVPSESFLALKLPSLGLKFVTLWNSTGEIILYTVASPIWQSWTAEDQQLVRSAAQDAAKAHTAKVRKVYSEEVAKLQAAGVQVHVPTPEEMSQWKLASRRVFAQWKVQTNPELVSRIEAVVEASRKAP